MIKPHGSDELNALYVEDEAQRSGLLKEAESLPSLFLLPVWFSRDLPHGCTNSRRDRQAWLGKSSSLPNTQAFASSP